jgi:hypothetical protein
MPRGNLDFRGTEISMSQRLLGHCADVNVLGLFKKLSGSGLT